MATQFGSSVKTAPEPRLRRGEGRRATKPRTSQPEARDETLSPTVLEEQRENRRERLAEELLPMVKRMALKMRRGLPAHIEVDDLVGAGSLGLLDAVRKFDARKRVKIESYARHRIRGAMLDSLRSMDIASRDMRRKSKRVERVCRELEAKLGQPASEADVADELGVSLEEWHRTLQDLQVVGVDGLRAGNHTTPTLPLEEFLAAVNQETPFDLCYREEQREILKRAIAGLPRRERLVISLYYDQPRTMKQIAAKLGVDQSRVSQIHTIALVRLRKRVQLLLRAPNPVVAPGPPFMAAEAF